MQTKDHGLSTLYIILIVAVAMLALTGVGVFYWHSRGTAARSSGATAIPTEEQKAYFKQVEFSDAHMSAADNFLGATVTYLDARVTNKGTKTVRRLGVDLTFVDMLNQVVLRERTYPITAHTAPLQPGETRAFRFSFEHMPADWNQAPPTISPVYVGF